MTARYAISDVASLVGEPARAAILLALLDGRALPAGELAVEARLSAAATSLHLSKLTRGGLLVVHPEGRHRYYRLASEDVAHALEALGVIATAPVRVKSAPADTSALRHARTCYDHLAGVVAVAMASALERAGVVEAADDRAWRVTPTGARWFDEVLAIDVAALATGKRIFARRCLDWTERRPHIAGALGAAILERALERKWFARTPGGRALRVTARGEASLATLV